MKQKLRTIPELSAPAPVGGLHVRAATRTRSVGLRREHTLLFAISFGVYMALAVYMRWLDVFFIDSLSRTANAFYVLFSRDPHLAAIGFVWNPLPSLVQLPFIAALRLLHLDVTVAGNITSAGCGAATLVVLNMTMRSVKLPAGLRWILLTLYGLNPMILLYSANGLSEMPFILLIVLALVGLGWLHGTDSVFAFTITALASALALWTRYEALALTAVITCCLFLISQSSSSHGSLKEYWLHAIAKRHTGAAMLAIPISKQTEARVVTYLAVCGYSFGLWVFFNWLFMGDPIFFLRGNYSNVAQTNHFRSGEVTYLSAAVGSLSGSLLYGLQRALWVFPACGVIATLALLIAIKRRNLLLLCGLFTSLAIPLFQVVMIYRGASFGWLRFFMYVIPCAYLLLVGIWMAAPDLFRGRRGLLLWPILLVALLLSNVACWVAMNHIELGREEEHVTHKLVDPSYQVPSELGQYASTDARKIAAYMQQLPPQEKVLLESYQGYSVLLMVPDPTRYVITSDRDFPQILRHPYGHVTYILVPSTEAFGGGGQSDQINSTYPTLWKEGTKWTELVHDFADTAWKWKLYRVISDPSTPPFKG